jgi:hypothetical protein
MAYTNLPPNLYDYFSTINQRLRLLESAPDGAQDSADAAQATGQAAYIQSLYAAQAANQASLQAGVALQSANGKNQVHYSTSAPSGTGNNGDIWFQTDTSFNVLYQFVYNGGTWQNSPITSTVIASLDAGKITTGTLNSIAIYAGSSGQFQVSAAGALSATNAAIQGTITSSNGNIGGWSINSNGIYNTGAALDSYYSALRLGSGSSYVGNVVAFNTGGSASGVIMHSGSTPDPTGGTGNYVAATSTGLVLHGTSSAGVTLTSSGINLSGNSTFIGHIYYSSTNPGSSGDLPIYQGSGGYLYGKTSSSKFKTNIEPQSIDLNNILQLNPVTYVSTEDYENNGNKSDGLKPLLGLIAEQVAEIPQLKDLIVGYDKENAPFSIDYSLLAVALIPAIKQINDRLTALETK